MLDAVLRKMTLFQNTEILPSAVMNSGKELFSFKKCFTNIPSSAAVCSL